MTDSPLLILPQAYACDLPLTFGDLCITNEFSKSKDDCCPYSSGIKVPFKALRNTG